MRGATAMAMAYGLLCGSALAQEGAHWRYDAPPECPSEREFRERVRARLLREPAASDTAPQDGPGRLVTVEVRLEPSHRRASLILDEPGAPSIERTVEGDSCDELASGVALITALAFGGAREPADPSNTAETGASPTAEPEGAAPDSAPKPVLDEPPSRARPRDPFAAPLGERDTARASKASGGSIPLALEVGAGGWVNTWSAPGGGLGADAFVRLAPESAGWSLRAAALYGFGASYVGERRAEFTLLAGRAEGCPISRRLPLELLAEGCLALDVGSLLGRGETSSALREGTTQTLFWAAAVVAARLRARFGERLSVEGQGELGLPLVRHEFVFEEPRERVFRTPTLGFAARAGIAVEFL